jgi:hypothetical protein
MWRTLGEKYVTSTSDKPIATAGHHLSISDLRAQRNER